MVGCSSFYFIHDYASTSFDQSSRRNPDFLRTLDEMGYSSYQEYLDEMEYQEMMANASFPDPN